jgi:ribosomal protein S18 acetylase RimI-like enzyme
MTDDHVVPAAQSALRRDFRLNGVPFEIVDARPEHAPFLAWDMQAASRSHLERGVLDMFVGGSNEDCLRFLEDWPLTEARSWASYDNFIVAESEGQPVGALCGYFVEEVEALFGKPAVEVAVKHGWSHDRLVAAWQRIIPNRYVLIDRVPGAWVVESVAVLLAFRRMGLVSEMLEAILDRGRQRGATCAEIGVLIGNDAAQRAYEKAGFAVVGEARNQEYEAAFGSAGMRLLHQSL